MTRLAIILAAALCVAACQRQNGPENSGPAGPTTNTVPSGQPSGANGTPSGAAQT